MTPYDGRESRFGGLVDPKNDGCHLTLGKSQPCPGGPFHRGIIYHAGLSGNFLLASGHQHDADQQIYVNRDSRGLCTRMERRTNMLIHRLKVAGFLSYGPNGVDLPMEPLTVLIGPNGSGKSNFLEAIALLKATQRDISEQFSSDGIREWMWKGPGALDKIIIDAIVDYPWGGEVRHSLTLAQRNGRPEVIDEQIEPLGNNLDGRVALSYYRPPRNEQTELYLRENSPDPSNPNVAGAFLASFLENGIHFRSDFVPERSLISLANPKDYPALWHLHSQYQQFQLFRDWCFGPSSGVRFPASAHTRADFLDEGGTNLPNVLSHFPGMGKRKLVKALQKLFDGIVDVKSSVVSGRVALFLEEEGNREIPVSRLSDGTLRYLCLLAVLLHPEPPPLIVIEEPELGLHPDLMPTLADLMLDASQRTQLVATTHSDVLVDSLTDTPESVVVCEKYDGQTQLRRLDKQALETWLEDYRLGELWTSGELGGNRW